MVQFLTKSLTNFQLGMELATLPSSLWIIFSNRFRHLTRLIVFYLYIAKTTAPVYSDVRNYFLFIFTNTKIRQFLSIVIRYYKLIY